MDKYLKPATVKKFAHFTRPDYIAIAKQADTVHGYVRGILLGDERIVSDRAQRVVIEANEHLKTHPAPVKAK